MTRCLITGMTAQQANPASHDRMNNFAGKLREMLRTQGIDVWWQDPKIDDHARELWSFDKVFVGLSAITGLGSNRTYGALSTIERLWGNNKLVLYIDAPDPAKVTNSLQAIIDHPGNLTKPFFSYRKEYEAAVKEHDRLLNVVHKLRNEEWPLTLFPALPWQDETRVQKFLPEAARMSIVPLYIDALTALAENIDITDTGPRHTRWALEAGGDKRWVRTRATQWPMEEIPKSSRTEANTQAAETIAQSEACLIGPDRDGLWWNTRYSEALLHGTPISTMWEEVSALGGPWMVLPSAVEDTDSTSRRRLAVQQLISYARLHEDRAQPIRQILKLDTKKRLKGLT